jgi:hypothetical protein
MCTLTASSRERDLSRVKALAASSRLSVLFMLSSPGGALEKIQLLSSQVGRSYIFQDVFQQEFEGM